MFSMPSLAAFAQFSGVRHLSVFHQASHRVQGSVPSSEKDIQNEGASPSYFQCTFRVHNMLLKRMSGGRLICFLVNSEVLLGFEIRIWIIVQFSLSWRLCIIVRWSWSCEQYFNDDLMDTTGDLIDTTSDLMDTTSDPHCDKSRIFVQKSPKFVDSIFKIFGT